MSWSESGVDPEDFISRAKPGCWQVRATPTVRYLAAPRIGFGSRPLRFSGGIGLYWVAVSSEMGGGIIVQRSVTLQPASSRGLAM